MSDLYRPYSGTEGEAFKAGHCYQCKRYESGCDIELRTMAHSEDEPEYPREWVRTEDGPTCKAFNKELPVPRCDKTLDMFPEAQP